jgi:hypothetical protein
MAHHHSFSYQDPNPGDVQPEPAPPTTTVVQQPAAVYPVSIVQPVVQPGLPAQQLAPVSAASQQAAAGPAILLVMTGLVATVVYLAWPLMKRAQPAGPAPKLPEIPSIPDVVAGIPDAIMSIPDAIGDAFSGAVAP